MAAGVKSQSEDLKGLIQHQAQIRKWLQEVNLKITEVEDSYLEDTPLGNIVRGFEIDGRPLPLRNRGQERMFSNSSYTVWCDNKIQENIDGGDKKVANKSEVKGSNQPKSKKARKSSSSLAISKSGKDTDPDWGDDY